MIYTAQNTFGDIEGCTVGDLGCGAGMLSIACNLMGAAYTVGFDVDEEALDNAWVNCRKLDIYDIDLVQTDVQTLQLNQGRQPSAPAVQNDHLIFTHFGLRQGSTRSS